MKRYLVSYKIKVEKTIVDDEIKIIAKSEEEAKKIFNTMMPHSYEDYKIIKVVVNEI